MEDALAVLDLSTASEPAPPAEPLPPPCRRCRRQERTQAAELKAAREALDALEELLDWLRDEHEFANLGREQAERENQELSVFIAEFHALAAAHEETLERAAKAIRHARRERDDARRLAASAEAETERYERYVQALEARLRRLADAADDAPAAAPRRRATGRPALAGRGR